MKKLITLFAIATLSLTSCSVDDCYSEEDKARIEHSKFIESEESKDIRVELNKFTGKFTDNAPFNFYPNPANNPDKYVIHLNLKSNPYTRAVVYNQYAVVNEHYFILY